MKKDLTSTDSNWNANTCGKYGTQHSYSISHGNSNPVLVSCIPERSFESIFQHSNFSNSNSGTSFSDIILIFSSPIKIVLTSKISDSSKSFIGPTLVHSKQSDNSYCSPGLPTTEFIDVNSGKLSETSIPLSNYNRYDVATYKAKAPYLRDTEQNDLIKNVFVPDEKFLFPETERCFRFEWLKGYFRYKTITSQNVSSEAHIKNFFIS